eukprot:CAMPEP_0114265400 /NCGR_PEP_ID=MMETSP0058-20121206/23888_1 /TAXON_ID=36894 /ORGANISM="Pyramimonas parkeae, CCMP726" /LENGTH=155 /DNA_ID=CAMNT_0001382475 /DNA_START=1 /DNA_END=466 /DNA_ORIENTATION=-
MRPAKMNSGESGSKDETQHARTHRARSTVEALQRLDVLAHGAISRRVFPGCVIACGQPSTGSLHYFAKGYGTHTYDMNIPCSPRSIFDVASLTKVMATIPASSQQIDLEAPVCQYMPDFGQNGKEQVTIKHLLTHTSGLQVFYPFYYMGIRSHEE